MNNAPNSDSMLEYACSACENGQYKEALESLQSLIKTTGIPEENRLAILSMLGKLHYYFKEMDEAIEYFEQTMTLQPNHDSAVSLGKIYRECGFYQKSIASYLHAMELKPNQIEACMGLASSYRKIYDNVSAQIMYRKVLELEPIHTSAYRNASLCMTYDSPSHPDIQNLEALLKKKLSRDEQSHCHYALSKIYNDCGNYDKAFKHIEIANTFRGQSRPFDNKKHERTIINTLETFSPHCLAHFKDLGHPSTQPVFIVGLSRAGKTLVERLINSHPQCADKEELAVIDKLIDNNIPSDAPQPQYERLLYERMTQDTLHDIAERYLKSLNQNCDHNYLKITDTTPNHYRYLGMIHILFPNAKKIYCARNPLDHCLQMYFKYYENGQNFSYNLKTLGKHYLQYLECMEHWKKTIPNSILSIQYEDLIQDPLRCRSELFQFLDLNPDRAKPLDIEIKPDEVNQWTHFESQIKPLKKMLKYKLHR